MPKKTGGISKYSNDLGFDEGLQARQRKTKQPCPVCFLHLDRCICDAIPRLKTNTRLTLIVHAKELKRTTNTGRLAIAALENSKMCIRGIKDHPLDLSHLLSDSEDNYLLYPSEEAIDVSELAKKKSSRPLHIIVPDGNWRQASKVGQRHAELKHIPRIKMDEPFFKNPYADFHLRKEHFAEGMATLEAIAHLFGHLESEECGQKLMDLYLQKLKATLIGRGLLKR
jgi:DTW domain-containing protein YfiP